MSDDDWSNIRKQVSVSEDQLNELFKENDKMRPAYDAAMRLYDGIVSGELWVEVDWTGSDGSCVEQFEAACRRAKEGR